MRGGQDRRSKMIYWLRSVDRREAWSREAYPLDRQIEEFFVAAIFFVTKKRASLKCEIVNGAARVEVSEKDLIPAIIYHLRVWSNLTMQALAEKAGLKSHAQIARYESGASCPSFSQFQKILGALGKNIDVNIDEHTRVA